MRQSKSYGTTLPPGIVRMLEEHPMAARLHPTHFGFYNRGSGSCSRHEGFPSHLLMLSAGGRGFLTAEKKTSFFSAGQFVLIPADKPHAYGAASGMTWTIFWTHFSGSAAKDYFRGEDKIILSKLSSPAFEKALAVFSEYLFLLRCDMRIGSLIEASQILGRLLTILFYQEGAVSVFESSSDGLERAVRFMERNTGARLTLAQIAAESGYSRPHFSALFKRRAGFSPLDYFNHLKIREACRLLESSQLRVGEISEKTGFENRNYFSRLFAKVMGCSPLEHRKRRAENTP